MFSFVFVIFSRLIYHKYELTYSQGILSLKGREIQGKNKEIKKELEKGEVSSLAIVDGYSNSINSFLSLECQTSHLNSDLGLTQSAINAQFTSCAGVGMYLY